MLLISSYYLVEVSTVQCNGPILFLRSITLYVKCMYYGVGRNPHKQTEHATSAQKGYS